MKNEGFEISIKQLKVILSIGTIILAFFLVYKFVFMSSREQLLDGSLRNIREENFQGFVIDKNYDTAYEKYNNVLDNIHEFLSLLENS